MQHSQKVCPVEVQAKLDPFYREHRSAPVRCDFGPQFCAVLEFILQFPVVERLAKPIVESVSINRQGRMMINGVPAGKASVFETEIRDWAYMTDLNDIFERSSFQAMLDTNIGTQDGARRIAL